MTTSSSLSAPEKENLQKEDAFAEKNTSEQEHIQATTHPKYRPDIDGLRAIAVLAVVAFHAFPMTKLLKGGFIGVDIFFVISGFLISTIIFRSLQQGVFSFSEFYARRIKRIYPALLVVLLFCIVCGWFVLYNGEYKQLGKHVLGGAGFVANLVYLAESNYFDNLADTKPLLHLWSLGIEEQFYFFWPLILWVAMKRKWNLLLVTIAVIAASFSINIMYVTQNATLTFYAPHTRFWELLAGSLLAYMLLNKRSLGEAMFARPGDIRRSIAENLFSAGGLILLLASILLIDNQKAFPGWWALLPVVGAALFIGAGTDAWLNRWVLANPIMTWFGVISFPLYLWHWPLLSFARIMMGQPPSREGRVMLILLSILLAWLTYKFIEAPLRFGKQWRHKTAALMTIMGVFAVAGYAIFTSNGLAGIRTASDGKGVEQFAAYYENSAPGFHYYDTVGLYEKFRDECNFYDLASLRKGMEKQAPLPSIAPNCYTRDLSKEKAVFLWGDSQAQQLYWGLHNHLPPNWQILQVATSSCEPNPVAPAPSSTSYCMHSNWLALKSIAEAKPDVVVVAQHLHHSVKLMEDITEKLKNLGVNKIIFMGASPEWQTKLPGIVTRKLWDHSGSRTLVGINEDVRREDRALRQQFHPKNGVSFVSLIDLLCNEQGCLTYIGEDRKAGLSSFDTHHLTPAASDHVAKSVLVQAIEGKKE